MFKVCFPLAFAPLSRKKVFGPHFNDVNKHYVFLLVTNTRAPVNCRLRYKQTQKEQLYSLSDRQQQSDGEDRQPERADTQMADTQTEQIEKMECQTEQNQTSRQTTPHNLHLYTRIFLRESKSFQMYF